MRGRDSRYTRSAIETGMRIEQYRKGDAFTMTTDAGRRWGSGDKLEAYVRDRLVNYPRFFKNHEGNDLPQMDVTIPGQFNESGHGIDILALDKQRTLWIIDRYSRWVSRRRTGHRYQLRSRNLYVLRESRNQVARTAEMNCFPSGQSLLPAEFEPGCRHLPGPRREEGGPVLHR